MTRNLKKTETWEYTRHGYTVIGRIHVGRQLERERGLWNKTCQRSCGMWIVDGLDSMMRRYDTCTRIIIVKEFRIRVESNEGRLQNARCEVLNVDGWSWYDWWLISAAGESEARWRLLGYELELWKRFTVRASELGCQGQWWTFARTVYNDQRSTETRILKRMSRDIPISPTRMWHSREIPKMIARMHRIGNHGWWMVARRLWT